jgi:putative endonuclease
MGRGHVVVGRMGEDRAAAWYMAHGYRVLARNWRCRSGEIDLVCANGSTLIICEVKARSSTRFGQPFEAVTLDKQRRLRRLAALFVSGGGPQGMEPEPARFYEELRFDVASVLGSTIEVIEGAF